jgi:hypothetical protein
MRHSNNSYDAPWSDDDPEIGPLANTRFPRPKARKPLSAQFLTSLQRAAVDAQREARANRKQIMQARIEEIRSKPHLQRLYTEADIRKIEDQIKEIENEEIADLQVLQAAE